MRGDERNKAIGPIEILQCFPTETVFDAGRTHFHPRTVQYVTFPSNLHSRIPCAPSLADADFGQSDFGQSDFGQPYWPTLANPTFILGPRRVGPEGGRPKI